MHKRHLANRKKRNYPNDRSFATVVYSQENQALSQLNSYYDANPS